MSGSANVQAPAAVVELPHVEPPVSLRKRVLTGALLVVVGLVTVLGWGLGSGGADATFRFGGGSSVTLPDLRVPGTVTPVVLGVVVVLLGVFQLARASGPGAVRWSSRSPSSASSWRSCAGS